MNVLQSDRMVSTAGYLGAALVGLAYVAIFVAYPPQQLGLRTPGGIFFGLGVTVVSLLLATIGGVVLSHDQSTAGTRTRRLAGHVINPTVAVVAVAGYLVIVSGFGPASPLILGAVLGAAVCGTVDALVTESSLR